MPLGIGLAFSIEQKPHHRLVVVLVSSILGAIASTAVELTQMFLPVRVSNLSDIICNSLGGYLGASLYCYRQSAISFLVALFTLNRHQLRVASLFKAIAWYCVLIGLTVWLLSANANLSNWEQGFYLVLGNEVTGDRPWQGVLYRCYIYDRPLEPSQVELVLRSTAQSDVLTRLPSLVAAISDSPAIGDRPENNLVPDLSWYGKFPTLPDRPFTAAEALENSKPYGLALDRTRWLKSESPARKLASQLKSSQEFSIFLEVATRKTIQTGPARIIALSRDVYSHNFSLGQEGTDLSFRLRTPITGNQPTQPEFIVPDVFDSQDRRNILITFEGKKLNFYIQNVERKYTFKFTPATSFVSMLPRKVPNWIINLETFDVYRYRIPFYLAIAVPLLYLLAIAMFLAISPPSR